jgi:hypothetical protein
MVEFAVATAALSLLLLGLPVIGRLHSLQLATIEVARASAFIDSWQLTAAAGSGAALLRPALYPDTQPNDQAGIGELTVQRFRSAPLGLASQTGALLLAPFLPLRRAGSGFDLQNAGLQGVRVAAAIALPDSTPEPFAGMNISFRESYQLLGDDWASAGPGQVAARAGGLVLSRAADTARPLVEFGTTLLSLVEPEFRRFCSGSVDPEIVPVDRLRDFDRSVYQDGKPTSWRAPC